MYCLDIPSLESEQHFVYVQASGAGQKGTFWKRTMQTRLAFSYHIHVLPPTARVVQCPPPPLVAQD
jgi:hypothetical protein